MEHTDAQCGCGCGQATPLATRNEYRRGHVKGQPMPYLPGHTSLRKPLTERFWSRVDKTDGCWLWTGSHDQRGYGRLQRGARGEGVVKAHRLSYELHYGPFDDALFVCHRCDNPACVNPEHLFLGSHQDNMDDRREKARPFGRPPALDVAALAAFMRDGGSYRAAAAHFGVPTSTVYRTLRRHDLLGM